jgi:RNA polymerase sigma factor (sigma-70 family)
MKAAGSAEKASAQEKAPASDAELLDRVKTGDLTALGTLFDRHAAAVHHFASRVGLRGDADDVVQETFLRIAKVAASYELRSASARAWTLGIGCAVVRERRRAGARFLRALASFSVAHAQRSASPQGPVRSEIVRHLQALDAEKREVLMLTEVMGMTGPEAAEVLGIATGTVWTRLHHARRALRERMGGDDV